MTKQVTTMLLVEKGVTLELCLRLLKNVSLTKMCIYNKPENINVNAVYVCVCVCVTFLHLRSKEPSRLHFIYM